MSLKSPDVSDIGSVKEIKDRPFPSKSEYRITISKKAYETIHKHGRENTDIELCGVLIGDVFRDIHGPFLEITDAIRGEYAANQKSQVTFTQATWAYINDIKDTKFSDKRIVGWYHTHPRFGIFLSPQDTFIHENFFNQPWQTAFVIDPVSNEEGFFVWHEGKPELTFNYWIEGEKKRVGKSKNDTNKKATEDIEDIVKTVLKHNKRGIHPFHLLFIFLGITLLLGAYLLKISNSLERVLSLQSSQKQDLLKLGDMISNAQEPSIINTQQSYIDIKKKNYVDIRNIENALAQNKSLANLNITLSQIDNHILCYGTVYTWHQKDLIGKVIGSIDGVESIDCRGIVVTHKYMILPGDNLSQIAKKVYGSSDPWFHIFETNRQKIKDPNKIQPFGTLLLPETF